MASCHLSCLSGCVNHPGPGNGLAFGETKSGPQPGSRDFGCKLWMHGYSRLASGKSPSEAAVIQNQEYEVNWNDGGLPGAQVPNAPSSDRL